MDFKIGIFRTNAEAYTTYRGDGQGRDSYVLVGNGGLIKPDGFKNIPPRAGYQPKIRSNSTMFAGDCKPFFGAGKEATVLKYFGDGTGRDSYVVKDSGGMIPSYSSRSPDKIFYGGLRQGNPSSMRTEFDTAG